jgi:hypothetical protein
MAGSVKIFGREPAFFVGVLEAVLALLLSWHKFGLTTMDIGAIMAAVVAAFGVYTAWVTRDTLLGVGIGLAKAVFALALVYNVSLSPDQIAASIGLITILLGSFQRTQTSPLVTPTFTNGHHERVPIE